MCGIVGALSSSNITSVLVNGLKYLEYRGYDSAGVAVIDKESKELIRVRCLGKVQELEDSINKQYSNLDANIGIAHTRWATHGIPSKINAHPHLSENIVLVHNGIIENHEELRSLLKRVGYSFSSQTDTEVIAHLINYLINNKNRLLPDFGDKALTLLKDKFSKEELESETIDLLTAVKMSVCIIRGAYGLVAMDSRNSQELIAARSGSPLIIGLGDDGNYLASDQLALVEKTKRFIYLEEGDIAKIELDRVQIWDSNHNLVDRNVVVSNIEKEHTDKGEFSSFMEKEIFDQPKAIIDTIEGRVVNNHVLEEAIGINAKPLLTDIDHVTIVACGTSYHAGLVAKYWLEDIARVSCDVEIASEYRYRRPVVKDNTLLLTISQSGETADLLAALRSAKQQGIKGSMTICNVPTSSLVRESDLVYLTRCGVEIGVASTKAFTSQLVCLLMFTVALANIKGNISKKENDSIVKSLVSLPRILENSLESFTQLRSLASNLKDITNALFIGRGVLYPIAKEGDLKLKEISYIHSEAFAGGELKHGPLALVDSNMPVFCLAPTDSLFEKTHANIEEIAARSGKLIIFTDSNTFLENSKTDIKEEDKPIVIKVPKVEEVISPILYTVPLQLLSLYMALERGCDADKPRNLAKSVTVE